MCEQHFPLLALTTRLPIFRRIPNVASNVACIFVDTARNLAGWRIRAALRFQTALLAISLTRMIENRTRFGNVGPRVCKSSPLAAQYISAGAAIFIGLFVPNERTSGEGSVLALAFIPDWDMRLDALVLDQPAQHGGSAVRGIPQSGGAA